MYVEILELRGFRLYVVAFWFCKKRFTVAVAVAESNLVSLRGRDRLRFSLEVEHDK